MIEVGRGEDARFDCPGGDLGVNEALDVGGTILITTDEPAQEGHERKLGCRFKGRARERKGNQRRRATRKAASEMPSRMILCLCVGSGLGHS